VEQVGQVLAPGLIAVSIGAEVIRASSDLRGDEAEHAAGDDLLRCPRPARMPQKTELDRDPESIRGGTSRRHEFQVRRGQRLQFLEFP
jgi:hypothetical protein